MTGRSEELRTGDWVEVLGPSEIARTLDVDGTLNGLPFMPEMIEYCGGRFRILRKVNRTCVACMYPEPPLRIGEFPDKDVYFLEDLRCNGSGHDGCERGCRIFWKSAWLKKANGDSDGSATTQKDSGAFAGMLKTKEENGSYFCQSTRLAGSLGYLSLTERVLRSCQDISLGAQGTANILKAVTMPVLRKLARKGSSPTHGDNGSSAPAISPGLQPGELVEVRSWREIQGTLDAGGRNKGLPFIPDMKRYCGKRFRVRNRLARTIIEEKGTMRELKDTVILEDNTCTYEHVLGGCPRNEFNYWREIWLKRAHE